MKNKNYEDDDQFLGYFEQQQIATGIVVPIDEEFYESKYYRNVVNRMEQLDEGDLVRFKLDSPGGDLSGLVQLLTAIENTDATVIAEIIGECHSASSVLALSCPNIKVFPYAKMMVHFPSMMGIAGKAGDIKGCVDFSYESFKEMYTKAYRGFLTESELDKVWLGQEFWFKSDEIIRRLEERNKFAQKELKQAEKKLKTTNKVAALRKSMAQPEYDPRDVAFKKKDNQPEIDSVE